MIFDGFSYKIHRFLGGFVASHRPRGSYDNVVHIVYKGDFRP